MYRVTREIKFCFGHRLLNYPGKCRQLHGHNGRAVVTVESETLDELGMAVDFGDIKRSLARWIEDDLDHTTLLHRADPLAAELHRIGEPFLELDSNPTTETLAKYIYDHGRAAGLQVQEVGLWETDQSLATYGKRAGGMLAMAPAASLFATPMTPSAIGSGEDAAMDLGDHSSPRNANGQFQVIIQLRFCFGHRLRNYDGKCRRLHGHNARALLAVSTDHLDHLGMALDFGVIKKRLSPWIDAHLDHAMILERNDPLVDLLQEFGNPVHVLDEPPSTENVCKLLYHKALEREIPVVGVQLWETDSCSAAYIPNRTSPANTEPDRNEGTAAQSDPCLVSR